MEEWKVVNLYLHPKDHISQGRYLISPGGKKLKNNVLSYYSKGVAKCCLCGNNNINMLELDHIDEVCLADKKREKVGTDFYLTVKRNDYPDGYQVLCANCNWEKHLKKAGKTLL